MKLDVPPPPGDGVLTGGIWMVGLGGTSMLLGGLALGLDSMGSPTSGGLALGLGAATVAGGGVLIRQGRRRKARYVAWLEGARLRNPAPTGLPLLASGLGLFVAGSAGTAITFAEISNDDVESEGIVPYTIFGAALLSGVTLTGLGLGRHRAYRNWLERQPIEWSPYLSPTSLQPGDQAVVAGAIGRF